MNLRILTFALILILGLVAAYPQDPYSIRYSIEEGLPTSNIYGAHQDSKGYIWFATDVGVLRYDGYDFVQYNTDNGLGDNEIFKIIEDSAHRIWFLSLNGKLTYYSNGEIMNKAQLPVLEQMSHPAMMIDFCEDINGTVFFLYTDGHISSLSKHLESESYDAAAPPRSYSLWKRKDQLYLLNGAFIGTLNGEKRVPLKEDFYADAAYRYAIVDDDTYFFSSKNTVFKYQYGDSYESYLSLPEAGDIIFLSFMEGKLWIGTRNGLYIKNGEEMMHIFKDHQVSGVIKDRQGNIWVTTLTDGIKLVPNMSLVNHSYDGARVSSLLKDPSNNLWVGTDGGVGVLTAKGEIATTFLTDLDEEDAKVKKLKFVENNVVAITRGIYSIEGEQLRVFNFSTNDVIKSGRDLFFAGSNHTGRMAYDDFRSLEGAQKRRIAKLISENSLLSKRSKVLVEANDQIYIGTSTGLYSFQGDSVVKVNAPNEELNTSILDLKYDETNNELWVATNSKGVVVLSNNSVVDHYTTLRGLNSNTCYALKYWEGHGYFVGNNKGLNLIGRNTGYDTIINFTDRLHLKNERVNALEFLNERLYLGTDNDLLSFNPSNFKGSKVAPILIIDQVAVNGDVRQEYSVLQPNENNVTIGFTGISPTDFGRVNYEYRLNSETTWTPIFGRQLDFKQLSYGSYDLEIRASGKNGGYSTPQQISFEILAPFWKTTPFVVGTILVLGFLISLFGRKAFVNIRNKYDRENKRLQSEQERALLEKKTIELEQKALRLQMNPHFIFNTLNTIKGYYSGGDIKDANLYIGRFSKLLRMILENDEQLVPLDKEVEMLELYIKLIQLRYEDVFDYRISIDPEISKEELGIPPLLLQPLVENAIIHGLAPSDRKGLLEVSFSLLDKMLLCKVCDNGIGFGTEKTKGSHEYQSKALQITRDRVRFINDVEHNDFLTIKNRNGQDGTEVLVSIPILKLW